MKNYHHQIGKSGCGVGSVSLFGQDVTVYRYHTAAVAVLQKPEAGGKHARWWLKVHGSGIRKLNSCYHNVRTIALIPFLDNPLSSLF